MTVETSTARVDFIGNGATTAFTFPAPFLADSNLIVIRTVISTGEETTLTLDSGGADGYTVTGEDEDEGTVTVVTAPTSLQRLTIIRDVPTTQLADFVANDPLPAESLENGLDKLTLICADLQSQIDRCLQFSPGTSSDVSAILPAPEAGFLLGWNDDEDALVNYAPADITDFDFVISEFVDDFLHVSDLAAAQALLEITPVGDLGPLATLEPTGTGTANNFLRGDGAWSDEINSMPVGYRRVAWTVTNGNYGVVLANYTGGVGLVKDSTATPTWTLPANATIAMPIGTIIPLCNAGASGNVTLAITSDTLQQAGSTSTGSVDLEPGFLGGVVKVAATTWFVYGAGIA